MNRYPLLAQRLVVDIVLRPLERFLRVEAAGGIVLLTATVTALLMANSPWSSAFEALWNTPVTLGVGSLQSTETVRFWINDGLMTLFFLVVGLEVKREWRDGVLSDRRTAALPVAAALGGVVAPAGVYLLLNPGPELRHGWAIPTATDVAFAVGVLSLLGKRVPPALRALLLTLAIVDDVVAVVVIACYYTAGVGQVGLLMAAGGALLGLALQRVGARGALIYAAPGILLWLGLERAGIHPALAGVILGLLLPSAPAREDHPVPLVQHERLPPAPRIEAALHPWVAYGVMPLFALANAGVALGSATPTTSHAADLLAGIVLALVLGKPLGIFLAVRLSVSAGLGSLPEGIAWRHVLVLGCLGGIGFTMSIFIATLAFTASGLLATAKMSVLIASGLAAIAGLALALSTLPDRCVRSLWSSRARRSLPASRKR